MFNQAIVSMLPFVPRPLVWRVSKRYIAGETLEQALETVAALNQGRMCATLDVLGEDTLSADAARAGRDLYLDALDEIDRRGLDCNISVKLSQMGLRFDESLCREIARELATRAKERGNFLRIDMEDSSVTTVTLDIYRELRRDFDNVGTVVQSYLRRTADDVRTLLEEGPTSLRLCKGIYREPEKIAFQGREEVRESYRQLLRQMLDGGITRVGIATHDEPLLRDAMQLVEERGTDPKQFEFQMLLGVTEKLRDQVVEAGHTMRIYVPFGQEWHAYSLRRLRENPKIASHVIKGMLIPGR